MDTDVSHAVKAELDKIHARIDNLVEHNKLEESGDTATTDETAAPVEETPEGQ